VSVVYHCDRCKKPATASNVVRTVAIREIFHGSHNIGGESTTQAGDLCGDCLGMMTVTEVKTYQRSK
jgi:hypothetical protein